MRSAKWLVIVVLAGMLGACEVIADFDRDKLDEQRTVGPTPLPTLDGATALMPDGARPDGALIGPGDSAAPEGDQDASLDAAIADAAADAAANPSVDSGQEVVPVNDDASVEVGSGN